MKKGTLNLRLKIWNNFGSKINNVIYYLLIIQTVSFLKKKEVRHFLVGLISKAHTLCTCVRFYEQAAKPDGYFSNCLSLEMIEKQKQNLCPQNKESSKDKKMLKKKK